MPKYSFKRNLYFAIWGGVTLILTYQPHLTCIMLAAPCIMSAAPCIVLVAPCIVSAALHIALWANECHFAKIGFHRVKNCCIRVKFVALLSPLLKCN